MKLRLIIAFAGALMVSQLLAEDKAGRNPDIKSLKDKASYSVGLKMGSSLKRQSIDLNLDLLSRGLRDGLTGGSPLLSDAEVEKSLQEFENDVTAKMAERMKVEGEKNKQQGEAFLSENKKKSGVKTTASGLQYKIIKGGNGQRPKLSDTVKTHYRGTLINGEEFDSSYKRGKPTEFTVGQVIPGWMEALLLMDVGSKWQLFIPANLAYGESPPTPEIPPNATLVFDVELLGIQKQQAPGFDDIPVRPNKPPNGAAGQPPN